MVSLAKTRDKFGHLSFPYASANSTMEIVYVRVTKQDHRVIETI
jgi:hypothetical protein